METNWIPASWPAIVSPPMNAYVMLYGVPFPTRNRYGMWSETPEPCSVTLPEYSPAVGTEPVSETLSTAEPPAGSESAPAGFSETEMPLTAVTGATAGVRETADEP